MDLGKVILWIQAIPRLRRMYKTDAPVNWRRTEAESEITQEDHVEIDQPVNPIGNKKHMCPSLVCKPRILSWVFKTTHILSIYLFKGYIYI